MRDRKIILLVCFIVMVAVLIGTSCSQPQTPAFTYDPDKNYAAFLVANSDYGKSSLATMKERSRSENYEIGPVEFYNQGTKDFEPQLTRLTANKQIKIVWVISYILEIPDIKTSQAKIKYEGTYRYVPISAQTGPIKIEN